MRPSISEFSYGYAVVEEIMTTTRRNLQGRIIAPAFPSLYREGQPGGGYDVELNTGGTPLFLQFKMSHTMVRKSAREISEHGLFTSTPFYRLHLWPRSKSPQHELLLHLENSGNTVLYVAPAFHSVSDFNDHYTRSTVIDNSILVRPSDIGTINDDFQHCISYQTTNIGYLCSEPRLLWHDELHIPNSKKLSKILMHSTNTITPFELADFLISFVKSDTFEKICSHRQDYPSIKDETIHFQPPYSYKKLAEFVVSAPPTDNVDTPHAAFQNILTASRIARSILGCEILMLRSA